MSSAVPVRRDVRPEEYLALELQASTRHELVDGHLYAMGGASDRHNIIAGNIFAALHRHLPERCQVFMADMKLRIRQRTTEIFYYPDILVSCAPDDRAQYFRDQPILLVEVLSPTTERIDRTEKLKAYQAIGTLEDYVIADQDALLVEVYRRAAAWTREVIEPDGRLELGGLGFDIAMDAIYRRTGLGVERKP